MLWHSWWCFKRDGALPDCGARHHLHKIPSKPGLQATGASPSPYLPFRCFRWFSLWFRFSLEKALHAKYFYKRWCRKSHEEESEKTNTEDVGVLDQFNSISCPFKFNHTHHILILSLLNFRLLVYICDLSPKWMILFLLHLLDFLIFSAMPK